MNTRHAIYEPRPVQLRLKPGLHQWVRQQAEAQERSANWIINKVLEEAAERSMQQKGAATSSIPEA